MEPVQVILNGFFQAVETDPRIGVSHISLYCAIIRCGINHNDNGAVPICSTEIMKAAKIGGIGTYHRCIRDLHSFGYIRYVPSFNYRKKSKVYFLDQKEKCERDECRNDYKRRPGDFSHTAYGRYKANNCSRAKN